MWRVYVAVLITVMVMMLAALAFGGPVTELLKHWQAK